MASSIVFTDAGGSVKVEWNDGSNKSAYFQKEDYSLWRSGTAFHLVPSSANLTDIGQFQNSDLTTPYADADALEAAIGPLFTATVVINGGVTASITGMSTAAKQDTQTTELQTINTRLGANVPPSATVNGQLSQLVSQGNNLEVIVDRIGALDASETGSVIFRLQAVQDQLTTSNGLLGNLAAKIPTVPQLISQGDDTGTLDVSSTSGGSFTWTFTLGAGTSGILTLYGQDFGVRELIAATASQTVDGATGVIRWTTPYRFVVAEFTTQVGAGSTFDGQCYAF